MRTITLPYPSFSDLDGSPLNGGSIYIGVANQNPITSPIPIYWDADGTQPAAQPLVTLNGYVVRAGTPANVFIDPSVAYSVLVQNIRGETVYTALDSKKFDPFYVFQSHIADLANKTDRAKGSALVGYIAPGPDTVGRTVEDALEIWTRVSDYAQGSVINPGVDESAQIQKAIDRAISTTQRLLIDRAYTASSLVIDGANGLEIMSVGSITGLGSGTRDAVLTIKNSSDIVVNGRLPISAAYNTGYSCAVAVYSDNGAGCSKLEFNGVSVVGAKLAFKFGRPTEPSALISEIVVNGGYTYGCPSFCEAYGTQTVVNFIGCQIISDTGANPPGWSSLNRILFRVLGAQVSVLGGECLLVDVTSGEGFIIEPIADPVNGNSYGTIRVNGVEIEMASQLCLIRNPGSISSIIANRGGFIVSNCSAFHSQNNGAWIESSSSDFTGIIKIEKSNKFFCGVVRTSGNVSCAGNAHIYVDDGAFGNGFVQGLSGYGGGILHFTERRVIEIQNAAGQAFSSGVVTIVKYTQPVTTIDTARYNSQYNLSTGIATVPAGGWLDVQVEAWIHTTVPTSPLDLCVYVNGVQRTPFPTNIGGVASNGWVGGRLSVGNLSAGDLIDVRATQGGGSNSNSNGILFEKIIVFARN